MRIGILSDTHDYLEMVDAAVNRLNREGVDLDSTPGITSHRSSSPDWRN